MTDRYKGLMVVFEKDIRDDDAKKIIDAIKMIKGVLNVEPSISTSEDCTKHYLNWLIQELQKRKIIMVHDVKKGEKTLYK